MIVAVAKLFKMFFCDIFIFVFLSVLDFDIVAWLDFVWNVFKVDVDVHVCILRTILNKQK